jgi:hypothetical protein
MRVIIGASLDVVKISLYILSSACSPMKRHMNKAFQRVMFFVDKFSLPDTSMAAVGDTPAWTTLDNGGPRADGEGLGFRV